MNDQTKRFPDEVEQVLREAGWYPGRRVDDETMKAWFAFRWQDGPGYCMMFPAAWRAMREFGGLTLCHPGEGPKEQREVMRLDPLDSIAHDRIETDWILFQWLVEDWLYPLGPMLNEESVLAMTPRGYVYSLSEIPVLHGRTFDEALVNLLLGAPYEEVTRLTPEQGIEDIGHVIDAVQRILPAPWYKPENR